MARLHPEFFLRLYFSDTDKLGPGKAALLAGIERTGSISAAGREMGMSYKRAWSLVEDMNTMFREPLVQSSRGGAGGGHARLTAVGREVLGLFADIEAAAAEVNAARIARMKALLARKTD
ncbi:winged helix-turn-helix domain-containing protein [Pontibaca methylaminivorans]|uniref:winged helix-turn-helix domain-containing protein n=1 Tax=Pontibaca methylaminivorans TaxID=515897 RepID=UPI002FDA770A